MLRKLVKILGGTIVFIVLLVCLLGVWIHHDVINGRKEEIAKSKPVTYPLKHSDFQLYTGWDSFYPQFARDIKHAKDYVYIFFFSIGSGKASNDFFDLLINKAKEGVPVYYSIDRAGSLKGSNKWFKKLKEAGVHITYSNDPHFPHIWYTIQHRNHRRIAVIDGEIGYTGGMNIAQKYTKSNWHDYQIRMEGEGVADFEKQFCRDWERNTGKAPPYHAKDLKKGNTAHYMKSYSSGGGVVPDLVKAFDNAKEEIIIATPYFIPDDKPFMDALKRASKRDVSITIMWPKKSDGLMLTQAAYPFVKDALKHNMKVYQYKEGIFHGKVILIDKKDLIIGTVNIDARSFRLNDEMSLFMQHSPFVATVEKQIHKDLKNSKEITLSYFDHLSFKNRTLMKAAEYVHQFL